jgi:hypothetical protein
MLTFPQSRIENAEIILIMAKCDIRVKIKQDINKVRRN